MTSHRERLIFLLFLNTVKQFSGKDQNEWRGTFYIRFFGGMGGERWEEMMDLNLEHLFM